MEPFGWLRRLRRLFRSRPRVAGVGAMGVLILVLMLLAQGFGFPQGIWSNLWLNAAGDMIGGAAILVAIDPIVSRAAMQIRQHAHLDFRLFVRRIGQAEREIRVLDTFSGLFDNVHGPKALPGLQDAVLRGVHVKVLLMSPATDASRLRQEQLDQVYPGQSIDAQIHHNISSLGIMEQQLAQELYRLGALHPMPAQRDSEDTGFFLSPAAQAAGQARSQTGMRTGTRTGTASQTAPRAQSRVQGRPQLSQQLGEPPSGELAVIGQPRVQGVGVGTFELRLYSVTAPFTLYQRDDTLLFAMLPAYQFAHEAPQLEINAGSLTGIQILEKFDELWEDARPVRRLAPIRLSPAGGTEPMWVRYLEQGGTTYYVSGRIDSILARNPDQHFWLGEQDEVEHEAELVPSDSTLYRQLFELHELKYTGERRRGPNFYQMWPSESQPAPRGRTLDFGRLPTDQILQRISRSERSVRILDTSSILIGQDGDEAGAEAFVRAALESLERGATIRILLLAPTTSAARERAKEIRDQHFDQMVERNIQRLRFLAAQLPSRGIEPERLRVRLYDQLPEISVHQTDDRVLVGFLPYRRRSSMTSQLETERHSELGVYAVGQFERLWNRARPLDGLRYVILRTPGGTMRGERLLVRAWQVGRTWYLASARVEELLARPSQPLHQGRDRSTLMHAWIEEVPGAEFELSAPLDRERNTPVWDAFARIYSSSDPGVPVRALGPLRSGSGA